jgi:molybdopterin-guanine dinucleotide biosynthesis protein B
MTPVEGEQRVPAVVTITGSSGAGKTSFVERVLPVLRDRGLSVGTVKHASHGFIPDRPGSDSARHAAAGAEPVLLVGPEGHVLFHLNRRPAEPPPKLQDLVSRYFADRDLVLVEGFSSEGGPCVLISRQGVERREAPSPEQVLFAMVDEPLGYDTELTADDIGTGADLLIDHVRALTGTPGPLATGAA